MRVHLSLCTTVNIVCWRQGGQPSIDDLTIITIATRMWVNAQRDGRPAEYRWCPLFNAAKFR